MFYVIINLYVIVKFIYLIWLSLAVVESTILIQEQDSKKYIDNYVALASFDDLRLFSDSKIIAFDKDFINTYKMAIKKGFKDPVVFYYTDKPFVFYNSPN
jgi:hypothetical protein